MNKVTTLLCLVPTSLSNSFNDIVPHAYPQNPRSAKAPLIIIWHLTSRRLHCLVKILGHK